MNNFRIVSRVFRAISGYTAEEEAELLGISRSLLARYESGNREISQQKYLEFWTTLVHICEHECQKEVISALFFLKQIPVK